MPTLLDPLAVGDWRLPNRVVLAPLTRTRASAGRVPNAMMAEYYRQRASAGLMLSEATSVTPMGVGYPDTPGIWSRAQVDAPPSYVQPSVPALTSPPPPPSEAPRSPETKPSQPKSKKRDKSPKSVG